MGDLLIRGVDEHVVRQLKTKAEINGTSLQAEAKRALVRGAPLTGAERRRLIEQYEREGFPSLSVSGAQIVREVRDEEG